MPAAVVCCVCAGGGASHRGRAGLLWVRRAGLAIAEEALVGQQVLLGIHHTLNALGADEGPVEPGVRRARQTHPLVPLGE